MPIDQETILLMPRSNVNDSHDHICSICGTKFESFEVLCDHIMCHSDKGETVIGNEEELGLAKSSRFNWADNVSMKKNRVIKRMESSSSHTRTAFDSSTEETNDVAESLLLLSQKAVCFGIIDVDDLKESYDCKDQNLIDNEINEVEKSKYDSESDTDTYFNNVQEFYVESSLNVREKMKFNACSTVYETYKIIRRKRTKCVRPHVDEFKSRNDYKGQSGETMYQCSTCNRFFHSHQALGGHKAHSNRMNKCAIEGEDKVKGASNKHECTACGRVFSTGQALGGHRSSLTCKMDTSNSSVRQEKKDSYLNLENEGMQDENKDLTQEEKKDEAVGLIEEDKRDGSAKMLLDLNLPVTMDNDDGDDAT